jgi:hypothetical protein
MAVASVITMPTTAVITMVAIPALLMTSSVLPTTMVAIPGKRRAWHQNTSCRGDQRNSRKHFAEHFCSPHRSIT